MSDTELENKIITILQESENPLSAGHIAGKIYGKQFTRKVNPTLYQLLKQNKIIKVENQPPLWRIN